MRENKTSGLLRIVSVTVMMIIAVGYCYSQAPTSIKDPTIGNPNNFIYDPDGYLSPETAEGINELILKARKSSTCQIAVAIVDNLDGMSIEDYAYKLFNHWKIGAKDKNNGLLLLIAPKERAAKIEVGSGAEGVFTDISCAKLMRRRIVPLMKEGKVNQAVFGAVNDIERALRNKDFADELRSNNEDTTMRRIETISPRAVLNFAKYVVLCVFLFTLALFIIDFAGTRGKRNYRRAMTWRNHRGSYIWGTVLSLGTALPIAFLAWLLYKRARNKTEICDTCGSKMEKLSEDQDNDYLTPSQDFEEKLHTVDYDVWKCPQCGTIESFPYVEKQLKYKECPKCHTIAMNLAMAKVVVPATTKHAGRGEKVYQCQFCRHTERKDYEIPKKEDLSALGAAAAIGAMSSGGRGGGGGFGSGFGGGHSSGGGATGHW